MLLTEALVRAVGVTVTLGLPVVDKLALPDAVGAADAAPLALGLPEALGGADRDGDGRSDLLAAQLADAVTLALALSLRDAWPPAPRSAASSSRSAAVSGARRRGPAIARLGQAS